MIRRKKAKQNWITEITMALINESQHEKTCLRGFRPYNPRINQLQRLARMLKFCVYSKFITYTFLRLNNKVAYQTARLLRLVCAFVVEMHLATRPITHISVIACFNILARSIYDMCNVWYCRIRGTLKEK